ncbi:hypothetical protein ACU4GD_31810 [Cupriavidus basilensis]
MLPRARHAREFILSQDQPAGQLPGGAGDAAGVLVYGHARLGAGQVVAGGFDNLSILSNGIVSFDGNVSPSHHRPDPGISGAGSLALADGAADASRIYLAAPYMRLAGVGAVAVADGKIRPTVRGGISGQASAGQLRIEAGGGAGYARQSERRCAWRHGSDRGETRRCRRSPRVLRPARAGQPRRSALAGRHGHGAEHNLEHAGRSLSGAAASRIYPTMGATATVRAGYLGTNADFRPAPQAGDRPDGGWRAARALRRVFGTAQPGRGSDRARRRAARRWE